MQSLVHRLRAGQSDQVDVAILGGGPGGTSTAIALARAGWSVIVMERSHYDSPRIGETLLPQVSVPLMELGVWHQFLLDEHIQSPGVTAVWGQTEPYDNDFIVNPYGSGWHVDRRRFDTMLARAAETSGAEVLRDTTPITCIWDAKVAWHLEAIAGRTVKRWHAAVLVDATGRLASPARSLGGRRIVYDRLVGLVGLIPVVSETIVDRRTSIEAVQEGWWYAAVLPGGRNIAAFMTDADLMPRGISARNAFWRDQLQQASHTWARLGDGALDIEHRAVSAASSYLMCVVGPGRLAVGDAAMTMDPLSSQGVMWALESGLAGAKAVDAYLRGNTMALNSYARWVKSVFVDYLETRAEYYRRECRWPDRPFWRRRRAAE